MPSIILQYTIRYHPVPFEKILYHSVPSSTIQYSPLPSNNIYCYPVPFQNIQYHSVPSRINQQLPVPFRIISSLFSLVKTMKMYLYAAICTVHVIDTTLYIHLTKRLMLQSKSLKEYLEVLLVCKPCTYICKPAKYLLLVT